MAEPDVLEGALRIARVEYPDLDVDRTRALLEELARKAAERIVGRDRRALAQLNSYFFDELGFHGNTDDYEDPRNSYLNDVLERRTGIPITLSTVYCEIARRAGLPASGVGFPGHFLVACPVGRSEVLIDCFHGRVLTREDCQELLDSTRSGATLTEDMFAVASPRDILSRMLNNLRRIHEGRGDLPRVLRWIEMDMELRPDDPRNYRDRGILRAQTEDFGKALSDFEQYARLAPGAPDLPQIRQQIRLLGKLLSNLN